MGSPSIVHNASINRTQNHLIICTYVPLSIACLAKLCAVTVKINKRLKYCHTCRFKVYAVNDASFVLRDFDVRVTKAAVWAMPVELRHDLMKH
jgi:hypothetical protein